MSQKVGVEKVAAAMSISIGLARVLFDSSTKEYLFLFDCGLSDALIF